MWSPASGPVLPQCQEQLHAPALLEGAHTEPATGILWFQILLYLISEPLKSTEQICYFIFSLLLSCVPLYSLPYTVFISDNYLL